MNTHLPASRPTPVRFAVLTITALTLSAVTVSTLAARFRRDEALISVKRAYKMGDMDRYKLAFSAKLNVPMTGELELKMNATLKETTKESKADGSALLQSVVEQANLKIGDQESEVTSFLSPFFQKVDKQGKVVEIKMEGGENQLGQRLGDIFQQVFQMEGAFYPPKAVKTGETWKLDATKIKQPDGTQEVTGSATYVGKETVKKVETLKIKLIRDTSFTSDKAQLNSKTHFEGYGNIDPKDGKFVKITGAIEGSTGPLKKGEFSVDRLFGDERDNEKKDTEKKADADKKP